MSSDMAESQGKTPLSCAPADYWLVSYCNLLAELLVEKISPGHLRKIPVLSTVQLNLSSFKSFRSNMRVILLIKPRLVVLKSIGSPRSSGHRSVKCALEIY